MMANFYSYRNQQRAENHSRQTLLRRYFVAWQVYVVGEQERRNLERQQNTTRSKMAQLLEAAATGKLMGAGDGDDTARGSEAGVKGNSREGRRSGRREKPSTADKIVSWFLFAFFFAPNTFKRFKSWTHF